MTTLGLVSTIVGIVLILASAMTFVASFDDFWLAVPGLVMYLTGIVLYAMPIVLQSEKPYETVLLVPVAILVGIIGTPIAWLTMFAGIMMLFLVRSMIS